jgi:uncharacterized protein
MSSYYFDTSALVKLYVFETGSRWIKGIYDAYDDEIALAIIGVTEAAAALARRNRIGELPARHQGFLYHRLLSDSKTRFNLFIIDDALAFQAAELTQRHPLRGYDSIHLASALKLNQQLVTNGLAPLTFLSADAVLCSAAISEGLAADNPNEHF